MNFDGATYNRELDSERLGRQLDRVRSILLQCRGRWLSLQELSQRTGAPEASVSARLRDLRKERFGGYEIETRRVKGGLFVYRMPAEVGQMRLL